MLTSNLLPNIGNLGRLPQGRKLPNTRLSAVSTTLSGLPFPTFPLIECMEFNAGDLLTLFALQQWHITPSGACAASFNSLPPLDKLLLPYSPLQLHLRVSTMEELLTFRYNLTAKGRPSPLQKGPPC